ncbi:hypothetical protein Sste5346_003242 [Sporothrix stenoceras]|uniref:Uncharacterized protein n=1 Tax=Sporothrix stenoceras TaxID=5173 RepID=A0ABR3ZF10_9PEZI
MDIQGLLSDKTYFCTTTINTHTTYSHNNNNPLWLLPHESAIVSSPAFYSSSTNAMSSDSATRQWTLVLVLTALFLSLVVVGQIIARYGAAYWAAPREITALLDSADSSLHENESYDRDVAKVARRDDKIRLGRLLGEIQRAGDDLREDLNNVLVIPREDNDSLDYSEKSEADIDIRLDLSGSRRRTTTASRQPPAHHISSSSPSPRLKTSARILWAAKRTHLEERLRRLDLLRMRFLVVYMSVVAATATAAAERVEKSAEKSAEIATTNAATAAATAARANAAAAVAASSTLTARNTSSSNANANRNASARRSSRSTSSGSSSSSDDSSCSSSSSSAANSPLMSATPSMPTSPSARSKTTADIVAASIAAAAAAAMAAGDTDDVYYPSSPTSMPGSPGFGHTHPFLRSIQQQSESQSKSTSKSQPTTPPQQQQPSPPATPHTGSTKTDDFDSLRRKPPSRRVTTLGIRPPDATPEHNHRAGWMGVVQELQRSPLLHKRHTSIEMSMTRR